MTVAVDLSESQLTMVSAILRRHLPAGTRASAFGSRATGSARRYSDLDLALEWDEPLDLDVLGDLAEALSESELPFKVDVVDLRSVAETFRAIIEHDMIPFPF